MLIFKDKIPELKEDEETGSFSHCFYRLAAVSKEEDSYDKSGYNSYSYSMLDSFNLAQNSKASQNYIMKDILF